MNRKINRPICAICETHNESANYGIQFSNGVHICMDCAADIHDLVEDFYNEQLQHCNCPYCSGEIDTPNAIGKE